MTYFSRFSLHHLYTNCRDDWLSTISPKRRWQTKPTQNWVLKNPVTPSPYYSHKTRTKPVFEWWTGFYSPELFPLNSQSQKEWRYNWILKDYLIVTNPWQTDKVQNWTELVLIYEFIFWIIVESSLKILINLPL